MVVKSKAVLVKVLVNGLTGSQILNKMVKSVNKFEDNRILLGDVHSYSLETYYILGYDGDGFGLEDHYINSLNFELLAKLELPNGDIVLVMNGEQLCDVRATAKDRKLAGMFS